MRKMLRLLVLMAPILLQAGCSEKRSAIESISLDYPHGETRLVVRSNGEALLFYGALPRHESIRLGTFGVDELYAQLQPRLHDNVPREQWPNPSSVVGMVTIRFENGTKAVHLIHDEEDFAERVFNRARKNGLGPTP